METQTKMWQENILIVNSDKAINETLKKLLEKEGIVVCAANGEEALNMLDHDYCAVIIAGVDMPGMNGIEFYNKAVEKYPTIKERFLFFVEKANSKHISLFERNNLKYVTQKKDINKAVTEILNR